MRSLIFIFVLFLFSQQSLFSQNYMNFSAGYSQVGLPALNKTIAAYNFSRSFLNEPLMPLQQGLGAEISYTGVVARGLFLNPFVGYAHNANSFESGNYRMRHMMRSYRSGLNVEIYPREINIDSVGLDFRPFFRLGFGATAIQPRVFINDTLVNVADKPYTPLIFTYHILAGVGFRYLINTNLDVLTSLNYFLSPSVEVDSYSTAVHGSLMPDLTNRTRMTHFQFTIGLSFRVGNKSDSPEIDTQSKSKKKSEKQ